MRSTHVFQTTSIKSPHPKATSSPSPRRTAVASKSTTTKPSTCQLPSTIPRAGLPPIPKTNAATSSVLPIPPVIPQATATTPNGYPKPLPILTIRQLRLLGAGTQLNQRRRRKPPANPLLPLRPNRHTKRDNQ